MEQRVQELEQKLKKSEEQRQKLRENLVSTPINRIDISLHDRLPWSTDYAAPSNGSSSQLCCVQKFFREKTAITHELVRKHAELQADANKKDEELSQLRMARDGLQSQLEAVQTASEVTASVPIER